MFRKMFKKHKSLKSKKIVDVEETSKRNNSVVAFIRQFFLGCVKWSTEENDKVSQQTKKRDQPSDNDAKVNDPFTSSTSAAEQRETVIVENKEITKKSKLSQGESSTFARTDTPHVVIYDATMTTFLKADNSIAELDTTK